MKVLNKLKNLFLIIGLVLLGLNLVGLFIPLRNADIYSEKLNYFENDITLSEDEFLNQLDRDELSDK